MNEQILLVGDYEPLKISLDMDLAHVKNVINRALKINNLNDCLIQDVIVWLKEKELEALNRTYLTIRNRDLYFRKFTNAYYKYGTCYLLRYYPDEADIEITQHLKVQGNANGIINVLAHEVLHGILPPGVHHGSDFKYAMNVINDRLDINIRVRGIVGKVEKPKPKYQVYCPHCDRVLASYLRKCDKVNNPQDYRCKRCKGEVKVIINEP